jgi:hypothetical protein
MYVLSTYLHTKPTYLPPGLLYTWQPPKQTSKKWEKKKKKGRKAPPIVSSFRSLTLPLQERHYYCALPKHSLLTPIHTISFPGQTFCSSMSFLRVRSSDPVYFPLFSLSSFLLALVRPHTDTPPLPLPFFTLHYLTLPYLTDRPTYQYLSNLTLLPCRSPYSPIIRMQ